MPRHKEFGSSLKLSASEQFADDLGGGPYSQGLVAAQIALDMARERAAKLGITQLNDFEDLATKDRETFSLLVSALIYLGEIPYDEIAELRTMAKPERRKLIDEAVDWRCAFYGLDET